MIPHRLLAVVLLCLFASPAFAADTSYSPMDIINKEGKLTIADGNSTYTFLKGGKFTSAPVDMAGRTIDGKWKVTDTKADHVVEFVINGRWGWANGAAPQDDFRTMTLWVYPIYMLKKSPSSTYHTYFLIEQLKKKGN